MVLRIINRNEERKFCFSEDLQNEDLELKFDPKAPAYLTGTIVECSVKNECDDCS